MVRTAEGSKAHNQLIAFSEQRLRAEGYKTSRIVRLPLGVVDVYGEKNGDKAIVECMVQPSKRYIEDRMNKVRHYARLIIAIPQTREIRLWEGFGIEIWRFPIDPFRKTISIKMDEELVKAIDELAAKKQPQLSRSQMIEWIIKEHIGEITYRTEAS